MSGEKDPLLTGEDNLTSTLRSEEEARIRRRIIRELNADVDSRSIGDVLYDVLYDSAKYRLNLTRKAQ